MSPELELLDQLLGENTSPEPLIRLFDNRAHFVRAVMAMLKAGELRLLEVGKEVPPFRWSAVLDGSFDDISLSITQAGADRIA